MLLLKRRKSQPCILSCAIRCGLPCHKRHGIRTSAAAAKLYSLSNKVSCCVQEEAKAFPFYLANEPVYANEELQVTDKYTNKVAYKVAVANPADIDR